MEIAMNSEIKRQSTWLKINKQSQNIKETHTMTFAYKIPFYRTKCRQLSLAYVEPKIWNTLILDN